PDISAAHRLLPVRAERAEADATAVDHARRDPPGLRHDRQRAAAAAVSLARNRHRFGSDIARQSRAGSLLMKMVRINFPDLYQRPVCRHSQYGINVIHLATVIGSYLALFWIADWSIAWCPVSETDRRWLLLAIPVPYFVVLAINVSARLLTACLLFVAAF